MPEKGGTISTIGIAFLFFKKKKDKRLKRGAWKPGEKKQMHYITTNNQVSFVVGCVVFSRTFLTVYFLRGCRKKTKNKLSVPLPTLWQTHSREKERETALWWRK